MYWTHQLVELQATVRPAALALQSEERQVSFLELDQASNRLAQHLRALGARTETPVALYLERSEHFAVAALAVLKAGAAYVPLDVDYPDARIDAILRDSGAKILVSHRNMASSLPGGCSITVDIDADAAAISRHSAEPLSIHLTGDELAYIIYTSGSTGRPKGVEVTHGNLAHVIDWYGRAYHVRPADRASQLLGLAFDAAVLEIWGHMAAGASVHFADNLTRRSPERVQKWLLAQRITIALAPAITAEELIGFEWPKETPLRLLVSGGDTLHRYPKPDLPFAVENQYGPTECTVVVTSGRLPTHGLAGQLPSVGHPVKGMEIQLLDSDLEPVVQGQEGEVCIAGPQLARGYRNAAELTALKFVNKADLRLYRTGDRGRFSADGQLSILGRLDEQIKIRGFRVEPAEIVLHLNTSPKVSNSVVVSRRVNGSQAILVAYVVLIPDVTVTADELRKHLRDLVPDYMIPSMFVRMHALPVTPNGKCDREALPDPDGLNALPEYVENRPSRDQQPDGTQTVVAQLVHGLISGPPIGPHDNFFLAGGNSLLAAQLIGRLRERLNVKLNLRQLFEAPTVASLAGVIMRELAAAK